MNYIPTKKNPMFSFQYGEACFTDLIDSLDIKTKTIHTQDMDTHIITYKFNDGLSVTQQIEHYVKYNAVKWVLTFKNESLLPSLTVSELRDCDILLALKTGQRVPAGHMPFVKVRGMNGSSYQRDDFMPLECNLYPGQKMNFSNHDGRSSSEYLSPFFDINMDKSGVLAAIGWTGCWFADISREVVPPVECPGVCDRSSNIIGLKTGIPEVSFKVLPGESFRTSSILLVEYENGSEAGHNAFRKVIKNHLSHYAVGSRVEQPPLSVCVNGGVTSAKLIQRLEQLKALDLGFEYFWMDAGWFGKAEGTDFGTWNSWIGDYSVTPFKHPNGLTDVAAKIQEAGMKLLLWFEPERTLTYTPRAVAHPEWFFTDTPWEGTWLLNLGNKEALDDLIEEHSQIIERLSIKCYRQDANCPTACFWHANEQPDRKGMNEILHINGLYRFWDTLLERFPDLIIDNCAAGGRRIDIETLSRSIPLWRSDYQCQGFDDPPEGAQIHNSGISQWAPYSGTTSSVTANTDRLGNEYYERSAYSAAMGIWYWCNENLDIKAEHPIDEIRRILNEYKRVRPYLSLDFYLLTPFSMELNTWCAWQYDHSEKGDGVLIAFRRENSTASDMTFYPHGISADKTYLFEDSSTGSTETLSGAELLKNGYVCKITEPMKSRVLFYKTI